MLLRVAVVDQEPRVDPAPGLEPVPRVPASDPPPPRDHLPPVRIAPEQFDHADQPPPAVVVSVVVHADESITANCSFHAPIWRGNAALRGSHSGTAKGISLLLNYRSMLCPIAFNFGCEAINSSGTRISFFGCSCRYCVYFDIELSS